jgi:hypothetical protein
VDGIAERAPETLKTYLGDIALAKHDAAAEREGIGSKEMDVDAARLAMSGELEMMMFKIGEAVTHVRLSTRDFLAPEASSGALDAHFPTHVVKLGFDDELRAKAAGPEFGSG